uniref:hypothetical protein n=1 Tax=Aeromonas jandaei TaxID=650 RepID=UPI003B9FF835
MPDFNVLRNEFKVLLDGINENSVEAGALRRALINYKHLVAHPEAASWGDSYEKGTGHDKSHEKTPDHEKGWSDSR